MSRGRQYISFEGLFEENVLGTFKVIRGFAGLRDLAEVSTAMPYEGVEDGAGTGTNGSWMRTTSRTSRDSWTAAAIASSQK